LTDADPHILHLRHWWSGLQWATTNTRTEPAVPADDKEQTAQKAFLLWTRVAKRGKLHGERINTVKTVLLTCPLFCEFRDLGDFANITGRKYIF